MCCALCGCGCCYGAPCSEAEAAKDRIAELEKESAARKAGWDRDTAAWAAEKATLLEQMETRVAAEAREGASRMEAVTAELTEEYERLSDEHVALEREAKDLRAVSAQRCCSAGILPLSAAVRLPARSLDTAGCAQSRVR